MDLSPLGYNGGYPTNRAKGPASLAVSPQPGIALLATWHEGTHDAHTGYESPGSTSAVVGIAILIAVNELRSDFSQVARSDPRLAHHAEGVRAGRSAVY